MTETPRGYAHSQKVNPLDFLSDGETPEAAKERLTAIVKDVIQNGLSMRDGQLKFGVNASDMNTAKKAISQLKDDDTNYMRHTNDSLLNALGVFIAEWVYSQMPPAKNAPKQAELVSLYRISKALNSLYDRGLDKHIKPRQWDSFGRKMGMGPTGVSPKQSLRMKGFV
jgi:hypothetical protein